MSCTQHSTYYASCPQCCEEAYNYYKFFQTYGDLHNGELYTKFLDEKVSLMKSAEEDIRRILDYAKDQQAKYEEYFWLWAAQYKPNISKDKLEKTFKVFV